MERRRGILIPSGVGVDQVVENPELSIVIPTLSRRKGVQRLLDSIRQQVGAPNFEVLVVANLHDPKLQRLVTSYGAIYDSTDRVGVNIARNRGLQRARGRIVLFLDDDCELQDSGFLYRHFELHQQYPHHIGVGGRYLLPVGASLVARTYHWIADHWLTKSRTENEDSVNLIGGNCSFKLDWLKVHYEFNESIRFGGTETELNARLIAGGHKLLLSDSLVVRHDPSVTVAGLIRKAYLQGMTSARIETRASDKSYPMQLMSFAQYLHRQGVPFTWRLRFFKGVYQSSFRSGQMARLRGLTVFRWRHWVYFSFWQSDLFGRELPSWVNEVFHTMGVEVTRPPRDFNARNE